MCDNLVLMLPCLYSLSLMKSGLHIPCNVDIMAKQFEALIVRVQQLK